MSTTEGRTKRAHPFMLWTPDAQALNLLGDKWTLPIIRELAPGALRRHELQRRLGISTEMLGARTTAMETDGLLVKHDLSTGRLHVEYELTERGRWAIPVVAELARYGLRQAWGRPTGEQRVDLRALFELVPILMRDTLLPEGDTDDALVMFGWGDTGGDLFERFVPVLYSSAQCPRVIRQPSSAPVIARLAGTQETWVKVLTSRTMRGLRTEGSEQVIADVIAVLRGDDR